MLTFGAIVKTVFPYDTHTHPETMGVIKQVEKKIADELPGELMYKQYPVPENPNERISLSGPHIYPLADSLDILFSYINLPTNNEVDPKQQEVATKAVNGILNGPLGDEIRTLVVTEDMLANPFARGGYYDQLVELSVD